MVATRFDTIARLFAARRTRRAALAQAGVGLAAGALAAAGLARPAHAQDATPAAGDAGEKTMFLFLQSFQSGAIAPKDGAAGRYTLTLEQGLGQTIYFSDRPERLVGASPTPQFLEGLGFAEENPPNAALVVEKEGGETEIAVVELFSPAYEVMSHTATYEVAVLAEWEDELGVGFHQTPADLSAFGESFGAAHLFIDDCADSYVGCYDNSPGNNQFIGRGRFPQMGFCYSFPGGCQPCEPYSHDYNSTSATRDYWTQKCNATYADCYRYSPQYGCYGTW